MSDEPRVVTVGRIEQLTDKALNNALRDSVVVSPAELLKQISQLQTEIERLSSVLTDINNHEIQRMYQSCPDCWSDSLGCDDKKICAEFTGRGHKTKIQEIISEALQQKKGKDDE